MGIVSLMFRARDPDANHPDGGYIPVTPTTGLPVHQVATFFVAEEARAPVAAAAIADHLVLKVGPGVLYSINAAVGGSPGWLMVLDAGASPADGPVKPIKIYRLTANSSIDRDYSPPVAFVLGCVLVFSTAASLFTKNGSATAFLSGEVG